MKIFLLRIILDLRNLIQNNMKIRSSAVLFLMVLFWTFPISAQQKPSITFHKPENPARASAPFSEAVQAGNTFYLAGQIGMDRSVNKLAPEGIQDRRNKLLKISRGYSSTTA